MSYFTFTHTDETISFISVRNNIELKSNKYLSNKIFNESSDLFQDGTTTFICHENKNNLIIDTPGLDSIVFSNSQSSFKDLFKFIKNKEISIFISFNLKDSKRYGNLFNHFKQIIKFFIN